MKNRKILKYFLYVILGIIILGSITVYNLITTKYGKLDLVYGVVTKVEGAINPVSLKGKSITQTRSVIHNYLTKWNPKPIQFSNIKNVTIQTSSNKVPVRIYTPDNGSNFPVIIYSHGGGWVGGSPDDYDNVCRKLSKDSNAIVISVNYRLAPENPFPAGIDDVYNTVL